MPGRKEEGEEEEEEEEEEGCIYTDVCMIYTVYSSELYIIYIDTWQLRAAHNIYRYMAAQSCT